MPSKTAINWLFNDICYSLHVFMEKLFFFNKQLLKKKRFFHNFHRLLFMHRHICGFCVISLKCSINYFQYSIKWFLEYCYLKKIIAVRLLTNFTFVLWRISKWKFKVSFPMHAESEHIFLEEAVQCLENFFFFEIFRKKSPGRQMQQLQI